MSTFEAADKRVQEMKDKLTRLLNCGESLLHPKNMVLLTAHTQALIDRDEAELVVTPMPQAPVTHHYAVNVAVKVDDQFTKVKAGDLFVYSWGATMRRNEFYEVQSVKGSKVWLTSPKTESEAHGYDAGSEWITGPGDQDKITGYAKIVRGKVKLCENALFKVERNSWNTLRPTCIGKKESFYGD